ncbi:MAG TPA: CPBP family intramembrane glutamic endopeptidase [Caulobacteraceae bacterium]|nr:CPBP family intramembrane glutamic endopeptidase [Caulobacteraceae bacterium]
MRPLTALKGEIVPPPRSGRYGAIVILAAGAFFTALPLLGRLASPPDLSTLTMLGAPWMGYAVLVLAAALVAAAFLAKDASAKALTVMAAVFVASIAAAPLIGRFVRPTTFTVIYMVAPVVFIAIVLAVPELKPAFGWLRAGRFDWRLALGAAVLAAISVAVTVVYVMTLKPDLTHQPLIATHRLGLPALLLVGVGIAALNAAVEEAIYRGILMNALDAALGAGWLPVLLQALAFGAFHFNSTEPAVAGVLLTALLGLVLGTLRRLGRGMAANYLLHLVVDIGVWTLGVAQLR